MTVMFTDVVGSTELTNRVGDDAAREVIGARDELARIQVERHSGHEVKGMGDGLMVAFTSARRAIACAVAIQRAVAELNQRDPGKAIELKIGLNTGEVIREEADLFGATVNAAQRIAAYAAGGEVLVSEGVKIVLGSGSSVDLTDRGAVDMKGFPDPWRLYEVVWREEGPVSSGRTPYIGRNEERTELRRRVQEAVDGRGSLVMIGGEPGVGKTRLAEELMSEAAERGMRPLIGHCYETEGAVPYIPYVELLEMAVRTVTLEGLRTALGDSAPEVAKLMPELRRIYPDIAEPPELPPDQERRYLFNGMRDYLARASEAQPLFFVLDDLHWADDSTLQLLEHLTQDLHERRILIVGTYRDVELDVGRPLARMLERLLRQRIAGRISLRRLPEDSVAGMLRALSGQDAPAALVRAVYSETEGNPFFVEEVFHHLAEEGKLFDEQRRWRRDLDVDELDVPEGVRLVIGRRLERVGEDCRRALGAAAVIGRRFRFELLEALSEIEPDVLLDAIDDAQRAHLIVSEEGRKEAWFSFAHELIRQTLLTSLSLPRRQRMHLRIAEAFEQLHGAKAEERAADIAHHLYQAGAAADLHKTCHYLRVAGEQALAAAAFEEATRYFDEALSLLDADEAAARAALLHRRGLAVRSVGKWEEALDDWRQALPLYEAAHDADGAVELCLTMSEQLSWNALWPEAAAVGERGLALVGEEPSDNRCRLLGFVGWTTSLGQGYAAGRILLDQAESLAREIDDELVLGRTLGIRGSVDMWHLLPGRALEKGLPGIEMLRRTGDLWHLVDTLFSISYAYNMLGRFDEGEALGQEAMDIALRIGHLGGVMAARRGNEGAKLLRTGNIDAALEFAREDLKLGEQAEMPWVANSHTNLGFMTFWQGRWEEALTHFEMGVRLEPPGMLDGWDTMHAMIARAYVGDAAGATDLLERKRHLLPKPGEVNSLGSWSLLAGAVEALGVLGRRDEVAPLYGLTREAVESGTLLIWPTTSVSMIAGIAASAGARADDARTHFETALRQTEEMPAPIAQAETRRWYARALIDEGAPSSLTHARQLLTEALGSYSQLGMPKHVELAAAMLKDAG
ncbi:MAG: AAA family ATPase [Dehalococcoidia bacterium]